MKLIRGFVINDTALKYDSGKQLFVFFGKIQNSNHPASWTWSFGGSCEDGGIIFVPGVKKVSCWQSIKWECKWNGQQMALVRAPVVWDVLSMAVHPPELAPVLLPPQQDSSTSRRRALIQPVQLPSGEGSYWSQSKEMVPFILKLFIRPKISTSFFISFFCAQPIKGVKS